MRKRSGRFSSSVCALLLVFSFAVTNNFYWIAVEQEEDFSWEDDDDETPISDRKPVATSIEESKMAVQVPTSSGKGHVKDSSRDTNTSSPQLLTPAGTSPRASEDGSYDVVPSSHTSNASAKDKDESDGDSDWE